MTLFNKILFGFLGLVVLALAGFYFWQSNSSQVYSAIYLKTGDIYFGKLVYFPHFGLKNVYLIQSDPQNLQAPLSIQKFSSVFWGPSNFLKLNKSEVVWITKLDPLGQLATLIKANPDLKALSPPPPSENQLFPDLIPAPEETPSFSSTSTKP